MKNYLSHAITASATLVAAMLIGGVTNWFALPNQNANAIKDINELNRQQIARIDGDLQDIKEQLLIITNTLINRQQ